MKTLPARLLTLVRTLALLSITIPAGAQIITNDTLIGSTDSSYDEHELTISNCTLIVDGPHTFLNLRLLNGGILTQSFTTNGTLPQFSAVTNEQHTIAATNSVQLVQSGALTNTIVVTDAAGTKVFSPGTDYLISSDSLVTTISLTPTTSILEGALILINYQWISGTSPTGLFLTITDNLEVEKGAAIDVSGKGFGPNAGPGAGTSLLGYFPDSGGQQVMAGAGASHGGMGGASVLGPARGLVYGSIVQPSSNGSGGGPGSGSGGAGGGTVNLLVGKTLRVDGRLLANGSPGVSPRSGGGAGGSISIKANAVSGSGSISANGGAGEPYDGGGGAGGRIAIEASTNQFAGAIEATGAPGAAFGGPGTVYQKYPELSGLISINNGGHSGSNVLSQIPSSSRLSIEGAAVVIATSPATFASLIVRSNSLLVAPSPARTLGLTINGEVTIEEGAAISCDAQGYAAGTGPGAGRSLPIPFSSIYVGSGGGYGGKGGSTMGGAPGGNAYGSFITELQPGSGGGRGGFQILDSGSGGEGGGAVRLQILTTLNVQGRISANGASANSTGGGGGSGGGIFISARTITGTGLISANGGNGDLPLGGGGGGGRIAMTVVSNQFAGTVTAFGGRGAVSGGAGTIFWQENQKSYRVIVDNNGATGTNTLLGSGIGTPVQLSITNAGAVEVNRFTTLSGLLISSNASMIFPANIGGMLISGNAVVDAGGQITADGAAVFGPTVTRPQGRGAATPGSGSGGGYGGYGGNSITNRGGGLSYGSSSEPSEGGSSGASFLSTVNAPGAGSIRLTVTGIFQLNGAVTANGGSGVSLNSGGGSGGDISITAGRLFGTGLIAANGGPGALPLAGGGGGGRIIINSNTNLFSGVIVARGGEGTNFGGAGTVYQRGTKLGSETLLVDNGGHIGTNTTINSFGIDQVLITGGAVAQVGEGSVFRLLYINADSWLTFSATPISHRLTSSQAVIHTGGGITVDGMGNPGGTGIGFGKADKSSAGGGGHGGYGGAGGTNAPGGNSYGTIASPSNVGSGGGGTPAFSGAGGGALHFEVGQLALDGIITAKGKNGRPSGGAGGSGGSIWLSAGIVSGPGSISAEGGDGDLALGGGGGGGRIAMSFGTNNFRGRISAIGGAGVNSGGAGTIYLKPNNSDVATVIVDNGGRRGTNTPLTSVGSPYDLSVSEGARLLAPATAVRNLVLHSNSWIVGGSDLGRTKSVRLSATDLSIERGAGVEATGIVGPSGPALQAPGLGQSKLSNIYGYTGGGGGHGGAGGASISGALGGGSHGSLLAPSESGGAGGSAGAYFAAGGGNIVVDVQKNLTLEGLITADGATATVVGGGGSGGSVRINAGRLAGAGTISANGGAGASDRDGGGGGGRTALYVKTNNFAGAITAYGGAGANSGGAGTMVFQNQESDTFTVVVNNAGNVGTNTPLASAPINRLEISGAAIVLPLNQNLAMNSLELLSGGVLSLSNSLDLVISKEAMIDAKSMISADGQGYRFTGGPGTGHMSESASGSGAGHGGAGGASASSETGGATYGSAESPTEFGSRGGIPALSTDSSAGGGAVRMRVSGPLTLNGRISANGDDASIESAGGGAGGSIWITVRKLLGTGTIQAEGGAGDPFEGGGGGGGRIAIYSGTNAFAGTVSVLGGVGASPGEAGTTFFGSPPAPKVLTQTPDSVVSYAVTNIDFNFDSNLDPASLIPGSVSLETPFGFVLARDIKVALLTPFQLRVTVPVQRIPGYYVIGLSTNIVSGYGVGLAQNYTGSFIIVLPNISGHVRDLNGSPVPYVTLRFSGEISPALTDTSGFYSAPVAPSWTGTVTPSKGNARFTPESLSYSSLSTDLGNQDFVMISPAALVMKTTIEGTRVKLQWTSISGVSYQTMYSTNLGDWLPLTNAVTGNDGPITLTVPIGSDPVKFFRLEPAPIH